MTKKPGATSDNSFIFLHIYAYIAGINIPAVLSTEPWTATESVVKNFLEPAMFCHLAVLI